MRSPQSGARGWGEVVAGAIFSRDVREVLVCSKGGEEMVLNGEGVNHTSLAAINPKWKDAI